LTSPCTFGGMSAGSTMFWVDPVRDLACVFLTSGLITCELRNTDRMRISDIGGSGAGGTCRVGFSPPPVVDHGRRAG
jgi:hypothetical protein